LLDKFFFLELVTRIKSVGGEAVGPRRAADAQVDAAGVQRLQQLEVFGHFQGRVVG